MGFLNNFKNLINPDVDDDDYIEDDDYIDDVDDVPAQPAKQQQTSQRQTYTPGGSAFGGSLELKVVKPEKYDTATAEKIANHLLNKRSVVLNLEATNKESARRLIDFLSGVVFSIGGYIQRVATNTFIAVPDNVDVSGEQLAEAKKQEENDLF